MGKPLRLLIVEDSEDDALLLLRELAEGGYKPEFNRVETAGAMADALKNSTWDLILSDYNLPGFSGTAALELLKNQGQDIPFILVSGRISDEEAAQAMKSGAHDYILKDKISRLIPAVNREMKEADMRMSKRRAEEALHESEKKYRSILDEIDDVYVEIDLNGRLTFFNPPLCRLLGYEEDELTGMYYRNIMDVETIERVRRAFRDVYHNGTHLKLFDFEISRKDGSKRWVEASISVLKDSSGNPAGFRGIGRDITSRKNMDEETLKSMKLESVGILAGGIAHDFNNLLSIILGYISIAQTLVNPEDEAAVMLKKAEKAGFQATELTKRLITFSRGDDPWRKITFLGPMLKKAADFSLVSSSVRFAYSIPDDLWPVNIDEGQMWQVVRNLVINAGEAMPGGGIITIAAENLNVKENSQLPLQDGPYVRWCIADQGVGISLDNLQRIFDPYFTTKGMGPAKGMGLGLAISYSIVRKHEGVITAESSPANGAVFHVYLPAFPVDSGLPADSEDISLKKRHRILVMDDEESIRDMIGKLIGHMGFDATLSKNGDEALQLFDEARECGRPFSVIILDLTVKDGTGGKQAIKRLLAIDPDVKAIITTSYADDPVVTSFRYHGFSASLVKPFTMKDLKAILDDLLKEQAEELPLFRRTM